MGKRRTPTDEPSADLSGGSIGNGTGSRRSMRRVLVIAGDACEPEELRRLSRKGGAMGRAALPPAGRVIPLRGHGDPY